MTTSTSVGRVSARTPTAEGFALVRQLGAAEKWLAVLVTQRPSAQEHRHIGDRPESKRAHSGFFPGSGAGSLSDPAAAARRSASVERASVSSSGFRAGSPRRSASAIAEESQDSTVMIRRSACRGW